MTRVVATNIVSPLGETTDLNYEALLQGRSALRRLSVDGVPVEVVASRLSDAQMQEISVEGFTRFESMVHFSVRKAMECGGIDPSDGRTLFVLGTTKADADELSHGSYCPPGEAAAKVARRLGITAAPLVVCNACISGVTALLAAKRLIDSGAYDRAVVCGADCLTAFALAGFTSFKALSPQECRPFDIDRLGLNLGEAAATIILSNEPAEAADEECWYLEKGALDNDAYHISAPSPDGEGVYRVIEQTMEGVDMECLALVGAHGTATMFNDQMESRAIERAGMSQLPLSALKGYFGHTLGASGVLESIILMRALDDGIILPSRGYSERGVSGKVNISAQIRRSQKKSFIKVISGFGGCNGAILFSKGREASESVEDRKWNATALHSVRITPDSLVIDGQNVQLPCSGREVLEHIYRTYIGDYPKFHKMDPLSKLVFAASSLLVSSEGDARNDVMRSIVLFNSSSSIVADRQHIASFTGNEGFFPSPSVFVYTLPNISIGEAAIRFSCKGETTMYIIPHRDDKTINEIQESTFRFSQVKTMITGWVDCESEDEFEADMKILSI